MHTFVQGDMILSAKQNQGKLKLLIRVYVLALILALGVIALIGYYFRQTHKTTIKNIEAAAKPNSKYKLAGKLDSDLSIYDEYADIFSLKPNTQAEVNLEKTETSILSNLDALERLRDTTYLNELQSLVLEKISLTNQFIEIKEESGWEKRIDQKIADISKTANKEKEESRRSRSLWQKIIGKNKRDEPKKDELSKVNQLLKNEVKLQEESAKMARIERSKLKQRITLIDENLRSSFNYIESEYKQKILDQAKEAKKSANKATYTMMAVAGSALLLFGLLIAIFVFYSRQINQVSTLLEQERDLAQKTAVEKQNFLAKISHELRTPIHAIIGLSDMALESIQETQTKQRIKHIKKSGTHILSIVNEVLDSYAFSKNTPKNQNVNFDVETEICDLLELGRAMAANKPLAIEFDNYLGKIKCLNGDLTSLKQILLNVFSNAIKYSKKGTIKVQVKHSEPINDRVTFTFTVTDTGVGISNEKLKEIKDGRVKSNVSTDGTIKGTGLGLSMVYNLSQALGGSVEIASEVKKGTRVTIQLPFVIAKTGKIQTTNNEGVLFHNKTVVIVDDEETNLLIVKHILKKLNVTAITFFEPQKAVRFLEEHKVDLVFLDINMPKISGTELLTQIKTNTTIKPELPIIALTADVFNKPYYINAGFNDVLYKPFDTTQMKVTLEKYFSTKKNEATFSISALEKLGNGDEEFIKKMLSHFLKSMPQYQDQLKTCIKTENWTEIGNIAHTIKPTVSHLGNSSISALCQNIQKQVKEEVFTNIEKKALDLYNKLDEMIVSVNQFYSEKYS